MVPGRLRPAARVMASAALLLLPSAVTAQAVTPAAAPDQPAGAAAPDPASSLAPLPDLGVDWPDPAKIDAAPAPGAVQPGVAKGVPADQLQRYRVSLEGTDGLDDSFQTRFHQLSSLITNEGKPANAAQIDRRAREDVALIRELLRAIGRYDGQVTSSVTTGGDGAVVRLTVTPGDPYTFSEVTLPGLEAAGAEAAPLRAQFPVKPGDTVDADAVIAAVAAFKAAIGRAGFPFAAVADPQVTVDHATQKATLALAVTPGAHAKFGRIVPVGPKPLFSAKHLAEIARFHPGRDYDAARLEDFRRALIATGLVSAATVTPIATADPSVVDIQVKLDRAPPRTIAAQVGYATGASVSAVATGQVAYGTGQGASAQISWTHRNLIKPEGAVTFSAIGGTDEQSIGASLRRNNFHVRDRVLNASVTASHTRYDAYDARTFDIGASIERQTNIIWQKKWIWSLGTEYVATDERDTDLSTGLPRRRLFLVAAFPNSLGYDGSDDLLNPTRGFRLSGRVSPELSLQAGTHAYVKLQLDASAYQPIGNGVVLAGRVRFGSIEGVSRDSIAPSRRFYAGGGGSVRGYSYQAIGPLDVNGQPVGGRGLTELSAEARFRFGNFGVVPFLDAGNLYLKSLPGVSGLRYGTGLGVRYYSSFGPIRVDVGTPLNRRPGESRIGVYVSLGQAF